MATKRQKPSSDRPLPPAAQEKATSVTFSHIRRRQALLSVRVRSEQGDLLDHPMPETIRLAREVQVRLRPPPLPPTQGETR